MRRFGQLPVEELRNLVGLNCAELRARRVVLGGVDIDDDRVGLEYIKTADDRVEGKPHQATEVRLEHVIDPMHVDTTRAEQAMAAAELLRSEGLDVPAALQAIIEEPDSDE